jgi:hypothetical protein
MIGDTVHGRKREQRPLFVEVMYEFYEPRRFLDYHIYQN